MALSGNLLRLYFGHLVTRPEPVVDFPLDSPTLLADSEFTTKRYHSGSLGTITEAQAYTTIRVTNNNLAFDGDGLLQSFPANTPRITEGHGYWGETTSTCRADFNGDLTNAAWVKTNCTITQDLPTPFAVGSGFEAVPGCRLIATANGDASITQSVAPISPGPQTLESLPKCLFYWPPGQVWHGPVQITQDGFVVATDVRDQLVEGQWVHLAGIPQLLAEEDNVLGVRLKDALAGDSIGVMLPNIERGYLISSPIYTPSSPTVNRAIDETTMNMANYPTLHDKPQFTVIVVCRPIQYPLPAFQDPDHPRPGGTVFEINNPHNITAVGVGGIIAGIMTITAWTSGAFVAGDRPRAGNGVGNRTDIIAQLTQTDGDPPGRRGTYQVQSELYPGGQTTTRQDMVIECRLKNAQGYGLNWALKPDDPERPGIIRIGLTPTSEEPDPGFTVEFGDDPQTEDLQLNEVNCFGWTVDTTLAGTAQDAGWVALNGDTERIHFEQFLRAPLLNSDLICTVGSQYPSGGPIDGTIQRIFIDGRLYSRAEMAAVTAEMQLRYANS